MNRWMLAGLLCATAVRAVLAQETPTEPPRARGRVLHYSGELTASNSLRVMARVTGQIRKFRVDTGSEVRAGDVLAELDPIDYELAVQQAQTAVSSAESRLKMMQAGGRPEELARARADVQIAEAQYKDGQEQLRRLDALAAKGGVSDETVSAARKEREVERARIASAKSSLQLVTKGAREEEKEVSRIELARARIDLEIARTKLDGTRIRSPIEGIVGERPVSEGAYVLSGSTPGAQTICVVTDTRRLKAIVEVPGADITYLRRGQDVELRVQSHPDQVYHGKVERLLPQMDQQTHKARLQIALENPSLELLPGMFVTAELTAAGESAASLSGLVSTTSPVSTDTTPSSPSR